jgi:hypothetical protein
MLVIRVSLCLTVATEEAGEEVALFYDTKFPPEAKEVMRITVDLGVGNVALSKFNEEVSFVAFNFVAYAGVEP